jgi:hypothetical protein
MYANALQVSHTHTDSNPTPPKKIEKPTLTGQLLVDLGGYYAVTINHPLSQPSPSPGHRAAQHGCEKGF